MKRRKGERRSDFLLRAHDAKGQREFGKKRWGEANFGWGSSNTHIESKVYVGPRGEPGQVIVTSLICNGNEVCHEVYDYGS